jgi:hypothetical protein
MAMNLIYEAGLQGRKVQFVIVGALLLAVGALWWGYTLVQSYGLAPGDGGTLAPLPVRLAWGGSVALPGLLLAAGMLVYGACYITRIAIDAATRQVHISTLAWVWGTSFAVEPDAVMQSRSHHGQFAAGGLNVNAPWTTIRLKGRVLPLVCSIGRGRCTTRWHWHGWCVGVGALHRASVRAAGWCYAGCGMLEV